jgi:hypothetical protein
MKRISIGDDDASIAHLQLKIVDGKARAEVVACTEFNMWCSEFGVKEYSIEYDQSTNLMNKNKLGFNFYVTFASEEDAVLFNMTWGDFNAKLASQRS